MSRLIVSFAHNNYQYSPFGTEKFMRDIDKLFMSENINHLNFFGFYKIGKIFPYIGINFNGQFQGIVHKRRIGYIIKEYESKLNLCIEKIYLQHLFNWDTGLVAKLIQKERVPVVVFLHDYYLECVRFNLINDKNKFCGEDRPSEKKCKNCKYWRKEKKHIFKINTFIDAIDSYIESFIAPSEIVGRIFVNAFPEIKEKIVIRPHLIMEGQKKYDPIKGRLIIGYQGNQVESKGYHEWKKVTQQLAKYYEFKYLGIGDEKVVGVKNVFVSTVLQGREAMVNAIKKEKISIAFMWSKCPETYSYVYFELLQNGVFIVTFKDSGNIAALVNANGNGKVFDTLEECVHWLSNTDEVLRCVNEYRCNSGLKPERIINNPSAKNLFEIQDVQNSLGIDNINIIKNNILLTALYKKVKGAGKLI